MSQQQPYSGLHPPRRSHSTYVSWNDSWAQTLTVNETTSKLGYVALSVPNQLVFTCWEDLAYMADLSNIWKRLICTAIKQTLRISTGHYILVQHPDGHQKICTFCLSPKPGDSPSNCKRYATLLFIVGCCNLYLYVLIPNKRQILLFFL